MSRRAVILFASLGVAWGIPYLLIKIAVGELDPAMVVFGRSLIGAVLLIPIAIFRKQLMPVLKRWKPLLAYTLVEIVVPWFFLSTAETRLPSSTAGLLLAAIPVVGVGVGVIMGIPARLKWSNWVGILLGTVGVAALVGLDVAGSDLIAVAQLGLVVLGYAFGPAILSRFMGDLPGIGVVAASLALAAIIYVPIVTILGSWPTAVPSAPVIGSVVALGVICSALAFILMFALVGEIGPMRMSTITYVNPAVAIIAGAIVLDERISIVTIVGFVLVLGGSFLVTRRRPAIPADPDAAPVVAKAERKLSP